MDTNRQDEMRRLLQDEYLVQAIEAGAVGYLLERVKRDELVRAIRAVYHGRLSPNQGLSKFATSIKGSEGPCLSEWELAILRLIASGATTREIGAQLFLSEVTVKRDVQRILDKLGARNRPQAVAEACKRKIVYKHQLKEFRSYDYQGDYLDKKRFNRSKVLSFLR